MFGFSNCQLRSAFDRNLLFAAGLALVLTHAATPSALAQNKPAAAHVTIPPVLLLYKYAPRDFNDRYMLEQARRQVESDAYSYEHHLQASTRSHVFVFSADQVRGRAAEFVAQELLPVYKQRWAAWAGSIPDRLQFSGDVKLEYLTYANGALRYKHREDALYMGDGSGRASQLSGPVDDFRLPASVLQAPQPGAGSGGLQFAADRALRVPPLKMERASAERLWVPPQCSTTEPRLQPSGSRLSRQAALEAWQTAREAVQKCRVEKAAYKPRLLIVFDVQTEGVTADGARRILKTKLIGAKVFGPRNELLASIAASDFPEATDNPLIEAERKAAAEKAKAEQKTREQEARRKAGQEAEARRTAGRARVEALLAGRSGNLLIRRAGDARIEKVYATDPSEKKGYEKVVREKILDLPAEAKELGSKDMAKALRDEADAAIVVNSTILRENITEAVLDLDLVVEEFPPKEASAFAPPSAAALAALVPDDAPILILRHRGTQPATRVFVQDVIRNDTRIDFARRISRAIESADISLKDYGLDKIVRYDSGSFDFPHKADEIALNRAPYALRRDRSAVVVVTREGLKAIYPRIADLDLAVVRFPPVEVHFGLAKDRKESAETFSIAGVSGRMNEASAAAALAAAFAPHELSRDPGKGIIRGSRGQCDIPDMNGAGAAAEAGAYCVVAKMAAGKAAQVLSRQVLPGDAIDTALDALKERYRWMELSREITHIERGGKRVVIGYGAVLAADRPALGRVAALPPPTAMEAVVWKANGATTVILQLDSAPTVFEVKTAKSAVLQLDPPKIAGLQTNSAPAAVQPRQAPPPSNTAGAHCREESSLRSTDWTVSTSLTFVNGDTAPLQLYWIDYQGVRKLYGTLGPYQTHFQQTYLTHPWVVADENGNCLAVHMPEAAPRQIYVSGKLADAPASSGTRPPAQTWPR